MKELLKCLFVVLCCLSLMSCGGKRPKLDLGYNPNTYAAPQRNADKNKSATSSDYSKYPDQTVPPIQTMEQGWELFDGQPLSARDAVIQPASNQRWNPVYFAYNQSFIGETERKKIEVLSDYLVRNPNYQVVVEGHCDERGSDEYNRSLGERRALAVRDYLVSLGVDAQRIQTISYGEERPVGSTNNEESYALNRRAEFVVGNRTE